MDIDSMFNFSYLDMAKAIIDRFNDLLRLSERLFPINDESFPLLFAVRRNTGNLDMIQKLLDRGEDINVVSDEGRNVLHEAVMNAYCSHILVKTVLQKEPTLINRADRLKKTALHLAMMFDNNENVVKELLDKGADIDARDLYLETPLHVAANFKYSVYNILLQRGADINPKNCYARTPLHCAIMRQPPNLNIQLIEALLSHGADVNMIDRGGNSVLHYAVRNSGIKLDLIQILLEHEAKPNNLDLKEVPPLGYCTNENIAKLLIQYSLMYSMKCIKTEYCYSNDQYLNFHFCKNLHDKRKWNIFRDVCLQDINSMAKDKIKNDYTFYNYISERYNKVKSPSNDLIPDIVLIRYHNNTYPSCKDMIYASIKHDDLLKKISNVHMYTSRNKSKKKHLSKNVYLNSHCVDYIATYLSKRDLMNLILAYTTDDNLINVVKDNRGSVSSKRNMEKPLSRISKRLKIVVKDNYNYDTNSSFFPINYV